MEQSFSTEKLKIPEVNSNLDLMSFNEVKENKSNLSAEDVLKDSFTARHYVVAIFFVCAIILFVFFVKGVSIYKGNSFIN